MRMLGAGRSKYDVAASDPQHFARHALGAKPFQDDEHAFLSIMKVIVASTLAWRDDVHQRTEFLRDGVSA